MEWLTTSEALDKKHLASSEIMHLTVKANFNIQ